MPIADLLKALYAEEEEKKKQLGMMPEVVVTAERPEESFYDKILKGMERFAMVHKKAVEVVEKPVVKAVKGLARPLGEPQPETLGEKVMGVATALPFAIAKTPSRWTRSWVAGEERGKYLQWMMDFPLGSEESKQAARLYLEKDVEMRRQGLTPESIPIELVLDMFVAANLYQGVYNRNYVRDLLKGLYATKNVSGKDLGNEISRQTKKFLGKQYPSNVNIVKAKTKAWKHIEETLGKAGIKITKKPLGMGAKVTYRKPIITTEAVSKPAEPYDLKKILVKPTKPVISEKAVTKPSVPISEKPPGAIVKTPEVGERPLIEEVYPSVKKDIITGKPLPPEKIKPPPEEIGRPPEEVGGLPFTKHIVKKGLPTKVSKLFPLTPKGLTVERVENKIITAYEIGHQQGLKVFNQAKQAGIIETKETFEERIASIKEKVELKKRFNIARKELQGVDVKHLRPEYQKDVKQILDQLDLTKPRTGTVYRLEEMRKYVETHPDNNIPPEKLKQLSRLSKTPIQDLTVENIEDITKHVRHFVHLNKLKNKLILGKQYRDAKEVVNVARVNIQSKRVKAVGDPDVIDSGIREPHKGLIGKIFTTDSYGAEDITKILDRKMRGGIITKVIYDGADRGVSEQLKYGQDAIAWFNGELQKVGINPQDFHKWSRGIGGKKVEIQTVKLPDGRTIKLTRDERIAIILHSMNDKNLRHLLNGGFSFDLLKSKIDKLSQEELRTIIASSAPQERRVAMVISKFYNVWQKAKLNERSLELDGWKIADVDNYYPIRTNILDRKRDFLKPRKNFAQITLEGMGIFKERTNAKNAIIIEGAFTTLFKNIRQTSAYYGLAKPLRNAKMLLMDNDFQKDVIKHYGRHYLKTLDDYIRRLEDNSHNTNNVEQLTTQLVNKMDLAILGANPFVMLKQAVSYPLAATEMDTRYLLRAIFTRVNKKEIAKWSPQLRDRLEGNVSRELGELGQVGAVRKFFTGKSPHSHKLMGGIRFFDTQTIGRIWNAVKFEVRAKQPNLRGDDYMKAVTDRAEEVIRLTQLGWHIKDRSAIARSQNIFVRLLTKYTSQRNKNYRILRRAILEYDISNHTVKDKSRLLKKLFITTIMTSLMIAGIDEARNKLYKRKSQTLLARAIRVFGNTLSYTYFVGDMFNSLASKVEKGTFAGWDVNNPLSSFVDNTLDAIAGGTRAIDQLVKQEKYKAGKYRGEKKFKRTAIKAADQAARSIGMIYGIPYATLRKLLGAGVGWVREEEPEPMKKGKNISDKLKELYK